VQISHNKKAKLFWNALLKIIEVTLENQKTLNISGFGTFSSSQELPNWKKSKNWRDDSNPAMNSIKFTPSKGFKDYLNN
jgi:nucleoid DNA-binding protein